jgi:hypothetical protein
MSARKRVHPWLKKDFQMSFVLQDLSKLKGIIAKQL